MSLFKGRESGENISQVKRMYGKIGKSKRGKKTKERQKQGRRFEQH
jgi:hypothetical protein